MKSKTIMKSKQQKSSISKKDNKNIFQKLLTFSLSIVGIITIFILIILLVLVSNHAFKVFRQNQKFSEAQEFCNTDPVVIIESEDWYGQNKYFNIYTPENPEYENVKTSVSSNFGSTAVYGYYCSVNEAYLAKNNASYNVSDSQYNYSDDEKQKIIDNYLLSQLNSGVKFYAPTEQLNGFKENVKEINIATGLYSIGYVGNTPSTFGRGESVPINLICKSTKDTLKLGEIVGYHPDGATIYQQEDEYNLNTRLYLPMVECSLETKIGELNKEDAVKLMQSVEEVDSNLIATYELVL